MIRLEFLCSHKFVKYVKDRYIERCFNNFTRKQKCGFFNFCPFGYTIREENKFWLSTAK